MKWLEETRGVKFELVRHFLARAFDSEMFSRRGQGWTVGVSAIALAIPAGMLLLDPPYLHRSIIPSPENLRTVEIADQLAILTLVFSVTGVLALMAWHSLFPSRHDFFALAGLPVKSRQVFLSRFVSVLLLSIAITLAMSLLPTVITPHQFTVHQHSDVRPLIKAVGRAASTGLGCIFIFFAVAGIQGALVNVLAGRWFTRVSSYTQGSLVTGFFVAGLCSFFLADAKQEIIARLLALGAWEPPVWFMGLGRVMTGDPDPFFAGMATRAIVATTGSVAFAALMYAFAAARYRRLLLEAPDGTGDGRSREWNILALLSRDPRQEAVIRFAAKVLARSRVHRMVCTAYLGAAIAILINSIFLVRSGTNSSVGWHAILQFATLYWPIAFSFIVLAGVRHLFSMPAELRANWIFQIAESQGRREWMAAVERLVLVFVIVPIYFVTLLTAGAAFGWPLAIRMTSLQALVSLTAFELLFHDWQQLPFACSYVPGKRPLAISLACWIGVLGALAPMLAQIIAALSQMVEIFAFYLGCFVGLWLVARHHRREGWGVAKLIYEDRHGALIDLSIKEVTYLGAEYVVEGAVDNSRSQNAPTIPPVAIGLRVYRAIARGFPHEFQNVYGTDLEQVTEEAIEPIWRRYGLFGLLRLLMDTAIRVSAEHLAELPPDIRYGIRKLGNSPGFTAVALVSLGLGICAATSFFSELNGTILRSVPGVAMPDELVSLPAVAYPTYRRYRERSDLFSSTLAYIAPVPFGVSISGRAERTWGHIVTPSYFSTLGVHLKMGRGFETDQPALEPSVVVSYRFWENRLTSDDAAIGKALRINGHPCTIVGVAPKEFLGASPMMLAADLWLPLSVGGRIAPELVDNALERPDLTMFQVVGRLKSGVSAARAEAELDAVARQQEFDYGGSDIGQKGRRVQLRTGGRLVPIRRQNLPLLLALPVVVISLVLLIACSNLANMMLARAADRRREIAVRLSLGASRSRLVRQLLTESMLLAAGAGVVGFILTVWLMHLLSHVSFPNPMPETFSVDPDWRVLTFTVGLTVLTGLAFGLVPAIQATRIDLHPTLKEGGMTGIFRRRRVNVRSILVLSQIAGSLMLLLVTSILVVGYQRSKGVEAGFNPKNLYLIALDPIRDGYSGEQAAAFFETLLDHLKRVPSILSASLTDTVPFTASGGVTLSGVGSNTLHNASRYVVGKDYFDTAGISMLLGRGFQKEDESNGAPAVVVSEALARELWKESPLGRYIEIDQRDTSRINLFGDSFFDYRARESQKVFEVVGVAGNVMVGDSEFRPEPAIYFPLHQRDYAQPTLTGMTLMVRTIPGVDAISAIQREVFAMDPNLVPFNARTMSAQIDQIMFPSRVGVWSYGLMGLFGLILACVGLAGVTAYSVIQRRHEIGIRIALGASRADVLGVVMNEGAVLVGIGTIFGLGGAWALTRLLSAGLEPVARAASKSTSDSLVLVGAPLLLAGLALVACYLPARKSMGIDAAVSLRQE